MAQSKSNDAASSSGHRLDCIARLVGIAFVPILLGVIPAGAAGQDTHRAILREKLEAELQQIADDAAGVLGVQIVDLTDGTRIGLNEDLVFPQASAIKVSILIELFHQAGDEPDLLRERLDVTARDQVGGSGILRYFGDGASALALEDLAILMIVLSDNSATNMLIDALSIDAINATMAELGLTRTRLQRRMMDMEASARGVENVSTPAEAAAVMARIAKCELPMSAEACRRLREILEIPKDDPVTDAIPGSVAVALKSGWTSGVRTSWALVALPDRPYVLTAMINYAGDDAQKEATLRAVSASAYDYFSRLAGTTPHGVRVSR